MKHRMYKPGAVCFFLSYRHACVSGRVVIVGQKVSILPSDVHDSVVSAIDRMMMICNGSSFPQGT